MLAGGETGGAASRRRIHDSHPGTVGQSFASYAIVFCVLALPWLRVATHAAPSGYLPNPVDQRLVVWILAWVAHALVTDPLHILDANINYPAPRQLASIEHLASTQVVFAPVFWLTGNAVLGANVATLLSYPIAAVAMERLLLALGCGRAAAWAGGLIFALGPERVPGNFMVLKYANLYLPLVALTLTRLRQRATRRAAGAVTAAAVMAFLSSYYLAVMAVITMGVWGVFELLRPGRGRARFALLATAATGAALVLLIVVSLPYLARPEASAEWTPPPPWAYLLQAVRHTKSIGYLPAVLAALGGMAIGARAEGARRAAARGLALTLLGHVLMFGPAQPLQGRLVPLPFAVIAASPARFFRGAERFVVLLGFGTALLAAAAFEAVPRRFGRVARSVVIAAAVAGVLITRGPGLVGPSFEEFTPQSDPIYEAVRRAAAAEGPGPLLELPAFSGIQAQPRFPHGTQVDAMLGSTRHWLPLVSGCFGCYPPPHQALLMRALARLPAGDAVAELVDMTHLRWLLLRPPADWLRPELLAQRERLRRLDQARLVLTLEGWELLRIDSVPNHPEWFAAIAAGPVQGRTVLGAPLVPIPEQAAKAVVLGTNVPFLARTATPLALGVQVTNVGTVTWPVTTPVSMPHAYTVVLLVRWWPADAAHDDGAVARAEQGGLRHEVSPAETLRQTMWVTTPAEPGTYDLEVAVRQEGGARFDGVGNLPLRARIRLVAGAAGP